MTPLPMGVVSSGAPAADSLTTSPRAVLIGPSIHRPPRELWPIVDYDQFRQAPFSAQPVQDLRHPETGERRIDLGGQALPGVVVNHGTAQAQAWAPTQGEASSREGRTRTRGRRTLPGTPRAGDRLPRRLHAGTPGHRRGGATPPEDRPHPAFTRPGTGAASLRSRRSLGYGRGQSAHGAQVHTRRKEGPQTHIRTREAADHIREVRPWPHARTGEGTRTPGREAEKRGPRKPKTNGRTLTPTKAIRPHGKSAYARGKDMLRKNISAYTLPGLVVRRK